MATKAQITAYERRLSKIVDKGAAALTSECVGAVAAVSGMTPGGEQTDAAGTLLGFTHRQYYGMFGPALATDVVLCTACMFKRADCTDADQVKLQNVALNDLRRNTREAE